MLPRNETGPQEERHIFYLVCGKMEPRRTEVLIFQSNLRAEFKLSRYLEAREEYI